MSLFQVISLTDLRSVLTKVDISASSPLINVIASEFYFILLALETLALACSRLSSWTTLPWPRHGLNRRTYGDAFRHVHIPYVCQIILVRPLLTFCSTAFPGLLPLSSVTTAPAISAIMSTPPAVPSSPPSSASSPSSSSDVSSNLSNKPYPRNSSSVRVFTAITQSSNFSPTLYNVSGYEMSSDSMEFNRLDLSPSPVFHSHRHNPPAIPATRAGLSRRRSVVVESENDDDGATDSIIRQTNILEAAVCIIQFLSSLLLRLDPLATNVLPPSNQKSTKVSIMERDEYCFSDTILLFVNEYFLQPPPAS